ncbi:response regulator transcription factor [Sphingomonas ginkgonis]|nr:response regulator transcription factor [Sphingomonas ginkgonis]
MLRERPGTRLALIDLDLPGMSRDVGLRYLAAHFHGLRIAVLFSAIEGGELEQLASSGVAALIPKQEHETVLFESLQRFITGAAFVSLAPPPAAEPAPRATQLSFLDHELTSRQREVLRLLSMGRSNRQIARQLGIAEGTVKVHVNAAFRVLGVHNRVSAAMALRDYFDSPEAPPA